jgi:hypothetical protein
MRPIALLTLLVVIAAAGPAAAGRAASTRAICSRQAETPIVDLYSFGIGGQVFEKFGHSMLCLTYPETETICFNYGVTNFDEPGKLVWGFMRARQKFWVDGERLDSMLAFYGSERADQFARLPETISPTRGCLLSPNRDGSCTIPGFGEDRSIWRQRLPLSPDKARAVAARLCNDTLPENRYYVYHHFYDNCTTRLRDLIDEIFDGRLREGTDGPYPVTFREFGRRGLAEYVPLIGLSDFITGRNLDRYPTEWQAMFHPDLLRVAVEDKLGIEAEVIYQRKGAPYPSSGPSGRPWVVLLSLLFTAPLAVARWRGRFERAGIVVAVLPLVVMSLLIWAIFFLVQIDWIKWNEALVLYVPTDAALFFLGERRRRQYAKIRVAMVVVVSLLVAVGLFRQPLWIPIIAAFLPLSLIAFDLPRVTSKTPAAG